MQECRLIVGGGRQETRFESSATYNMAVDEVLLQTAAAEDLPSLRFYGWMKPTVSLGYFQKLSDRELHSASRHCELVRRASGGGAILHDQELTYCFATPTRARFGETKDLYLAFHETLVEVLTELFGIQAALHSAGDGVTNDAFLCFQRRASGDVTCRGHKIAGSAQRRWKKAIFQHGSVILAKSSHAPELSGLREIAGFEGTQEVVISPWLRKLTSRLKIDASPGSLTDKEVAGVNRLIVEKFGNEAWTGRR